MTETAFDTDLNLFRLYATEECGADDYPVVWHTTIKHLVRDESGHRCVRCGHPYRQGEHGHRGEWSLCDELCRHGGVGRYPVDGQFVACEWEQGDTPPQGFEARYRILTVHHLDQIKRNCRWWNLAALCQKCHLTIQGRVTMAQVYPFEHSEWFRPYAAGYYAHAYLQENLTREQTVERMDELLALERAL